MALRPDDDDFSLSYYSIEDFVFGVVLSPGDKRKMVVVVGADDKLSVGWAWVHPRSRCGVRSDISIHGCWVWSLGRHTNQPVRCAASGLACVLFRL